MECTKDQRIVMTLDAGGTNFVFSAMQGGREIMRPVVLPAYADCLERCLSSLVEGFKTIQERLPKNAVAISFAFPGPADYEAGIIGDLPNFSSFRGGVALGPYLESVFRLPVYINNDGNLFAYGEALTGVLPEVNSRLIASGSGKRYKNLLGITLGTGFGAGVVIDETLLRGDNDAGGDIWCFPSYEYGIAEEGVSTRAIQRFYQEFSDDPSRLLSPKEIFEIAEGILPGNREAAVRAYALFGQNAGEAIATALTLVDGLVVLGGGLCGAARYFMPALMKRLNGSVSVDVAGSISAKRLPRMQMRAFDLDNPEEFSAFSRGEQKRVSVPRTDAVVDYDPMKRIGVSVSKQGASRSIAVGAYLYAINRLDK